MNPSSTPHPVDWETYVEQQSTLLDLPIPPDCKPSVIANLSRAQAIAQLVLEFPLAVEDETAPIFQP